MPTERGDLREFAADEAKAKARDFDINALDPAFLDDPFPWYHALRRYDPVHRNPDGSIVVSRYDDAVVCYRDPRMRSDKRIEFGRTMGAGPLYRHHTTSLVFNDPPLHTRVRKLIAAAFTPRALKALEPKIVAIIDGLLDAAETQGRMDLIEDYAFALPVEVICDMFGVPHGERAPFRRWSLAILSGLEPVVSAEKLAAGDRAVEEFTTYLDALIADRKRRPTEDESDILSALIHGEIDGESLTHEELVQNCIFILNAGHETTTNLVGNAIDALLRFPDQRARLLREPALIESAVEEALRFESSNQLGNRRTTAPIELGGVALNPGSYIHICIGGANRDPAQFPAPDRFDIARTPNRHLAFATGAHACIGMSLARMEGRIAISRLIARFPELRRDGPFTRNGRARFRGFATYKLALTG